MKCEKHKEYRTIKKPRANCEDCWRMYIKKNPESEEQIRARDEYHRAKFEIFLKEESKPYVFDMSLYDDDD